MKYASKFSNYRIVLRQGIPAEPVTGRPAVGLISVKFEDGLADTSAILGMTEEEADQKMHALRSFGKDFVEVVGASRDPFAASRKSAEPEHDIIMIEHGGVAKSLNPKQAVSKDMQNIIMEAAKQIAGPMAKEMLRQALMELNAEKGKEGPQEPIKEAPVADESVKEELKHFKKKTLSPVREE